MEKTFLLCGSDRKQGEKGPAGEVHRCDLQSIHQMHTCITCKLETNHSLDANDHAMPEKKTRHTHTYLMALSSAPFHSLVAGVPRTLG